MLISTATRWSVVAIAAPRRRYYQPVSDSSPSVSSSSHRRGNSLRGPVALSVVALVVAVAAIGVAGWALLHAPSTTSKSDYTDAQRAEAKGSICKAYVIVRSGVTLNTNQHAPGGDADVTGTLAVAANARLSLFNGGEYLL